MARFWILSAALASLQATSALFPDCQNGPEILRNNTVCDTSKPARDRAAAIVDLMTVAEKINNTGKYAAALATLHAAAKYRIAQAREYLVLAYQGTNGGMKPSME